MPGGKRVRKMIELLVNCSAGLDAHQKSVTCTALNEQEDRGIVKFYPGISRLPGLFDQEETQKATTPHQGASI
jgi:hypothetical protein